TPRWAYRVRRCLKAPIPAGYCETLFFVTVLPHTGLALASVPIRYVAEKWRRYSTDGYCDSK
ncbi:hypothetical protein, partial [Escherichia coli]|uniref:hypothetical protein n=1 Tax=Escherichia coli TaxID=562 RepID=UPI001BD34A7A